MKFDFAHPQFKNGTLFFPEKKDDSWICCICRHRIPGYVHGNNAAPVAEGKCCNDCNARVIIKKRMQLATAKEK